MYSPATIQAAVTAAMMAGDDHPVYAQSSVTDAVPSYSASRQLTPPSYMPMPAPVPAPVPTSVKVSAAFTERKRGRPKGCTDKQPRRSTTRITIKLMDGTMVHVPKTKEAEYVAEGHTSLGPSMLPKSKGTPKPRQKREKLVGAIVLHRTIPKSVSLATTMHDAAPRAYAESQFLNTIGEIARRASSTNDARPRPAERVGRLSMAVSPSVSSRGAPSPLSSCHAPTSPSYSSGSSLASPSPASSPMSSPVSSPAVRTPTSPYSSVGASPSSSSTAPVAVSPYAAVSPRALSVDVVSSSMPPPEDDFSTSPYSTAATGMYDGALEADISNLAGANIASAATDVSATLCADSTEVDASFDYPPLQAL